MTPTALRPRLTTSVADVPARATVPLTQRARRALAAISGDRPLEELVVLAAAVAWTVGLAEYTDEVSLAVVGPTGPVAVAVELDDATTPAQLVVRLDGALRAAAGGGGRVRTDLAGALLVGSRRVGEGAGAVAALRVTLGAPDNERRELVADAPANLAEPWFLHVLLHSVTAVLTTFEQPRRPLAEAAPGTPEDLAAARGHGHGRYTSQACDTTLTAPIAAVAAADPDRQAVVAGHRSLTYGRLWEAAGGIAARLVALGVEPGGLVGVHTGKSIHALPAILGVLRARAAYVPLDPHAPVARTAAILADAGVDVVLSDRDLGAGMAAARPGLVVIDPADDSSAPRAAVPPSGPKADDIAYVLYTSGSTDTAKGVVVRHRAVAGYVRWKIAHNGLDGEVTLLQIPSHASNSSISDLFPVLSVGGRLVLADLAGTTPAELADLVASHRVSQFTVLPSVYRSLLDDMGPVANLLRLVTVAGEPMSAGLVARHRAVLPGVRLVNEYGPAENSVGATVFDHHDADRSPGFPIGSPLPNTVVRVVTATGQELPPGFVGAIRLSGHGLADGYLGRPDLTAATFAAEPSVPFDREYDTGDLGWWRPDGVLEFAGRVAADVHGALPSGTVDRRALASADHDGGDPVEVAVTEVFREALGGRPVAVDDDFFLLGGHSLLALSVLEEIEDRLGAVIGVDDFFATATVRAVAEQVLAARGKSVASTRDAPPVAAAQDPDALARMLDEFQSAGDSDEVS
ncbi:non-ribosomal peptide synthetase [Nocardiopsis sp. NPDC006198]|uniref:non-ribosomal peptide synthetase n=1 Tax=Nocardiopsis sp. NPDC006198 TaxID=3154472 RepID=UPI0033B311B9